MIGPENRIKQVAARTDFGTPVTVSGWVRTRRDSKGGFSFVEINDGSSLGGIQVVAENTLPNYESEIRHLTTGCSIRVDGVLRASPGKGQAVEIGATAITVLGRVDDPDAYPLQKKRHTMEFLREHAHLRPRSNTIGAVARVRNILARATHAFFQERGFLYLHSPIITANDCEGAGEMFRVTTLDPTRAEPARDFSGDFFGKPTSLTVSGQLSAEAYACALTNVYTFGPTFRAENSNTSRHLAEFWMIEPEMAFCDLEGDMDVAEAFIQSIYGDLLRDGEEDLAFFDRWVEPGVRERVEAVTRGTFARLSYGEAIEILERSGVSFDFPVAWGVDLQSEHERYLTEVHCRRPVIVYDYPKGIKAFYMRLNDDGRTVAAMDVLVPGIGEIIGGAQREDRLDSLLLRMEECGLSPKDYWWYLDLRRYGSVPHAGFGLGFERTIQFATGMANIRDVIPFPRTPHAAEF